ncbi:recombination-associated protein RdgC [Azonexus sp. R2A61]|uniref:recombination-associated protein RdgC n=1 Tax=Azonexus sp. R2A61 TaxID=2744443 RepID=UPI001F1F2224|nr:recombination-associated protein RdgC [Azonexus sp. R2A61]
MWFKNMQIYRLVSPWAMTLEKLVEQLQRIPFQPVTGTTAISCGWIAPRADGDLVYAQNGHWLLRMQTEKRLLPTEVVLADVAARAEKQAELQGYPLGRKALAELREQVTNDLLPTAFTTRRSTYAWIDPKNGWCVIDAGLPAKADTVVELLRRSLDLFPLAPLHTQLSPQSAMADWLAGRDAPTGFTVDRDCELKSVAEEKAAVAFKRHPLGDEVGDEIKLHLAAGKLPTHLALTWDERISFVLTEKMVIKRLSFLDLLKEEASQNAETADDQFAADFAIMTGELSRFIPCLIDALGGEQVVSAPAPAPRGAE